QVFTIMSYNDGWATSPYGQPRSGGITGTEVDHFGWVGTLSPLDIAVIQDKYGVNEEWATGNDTYVLADASGPGVYHSAIWDAGGGDAITYAGARDATIDLRPATLQYEEGGGGRVSFAYGVFGGFTIANGVTIENARSGSGNDALTGNEAANRLDSGAGNDVLIGNGGNDVLIGGTGRDMLTGGEGGDSFVYQSNADSAVGPGRDVITDFTRGSDRIDVSALNASTFIGGALFSGAAGQLRTVSFDGTTIIELDSNGDRLADWQIELTGMVPLGYGDFLGLEIDGTAARGGGSGGGNGGGKKPGVLDWKSDPVMSGGDASGPHPAMTYDPAASGDYFL
ncbi:MAG TPA: M10 family metallopeptidase C-terminal domain-containing protein, partial [Sphingomicrobium sp.]|nr:M10 family metallopeptidase C-terminal domain-containing protein [Sphingomicrobium sp.]